MRYILCLLVPVAMPAWAEPLGAKPEILKFQKIIDGATIAASGKTISLGGA
jgi:hypothetical protein